MKKLKAELIELDKKRLSIRSSYKKELEKLTKNRASTEDNYVLFPKSVVSENNFQFRYGLPWVHNGFIIKIGSNIIAVDPAVDFVLRLTETGFDLSSITHIYISHMHLDHSADANTLMDFLLRGRSAVKIIAPRSVFDTKTISDFHSGLKVPFPVNRQPIIIDESSKIKLNDGYVMTFVPLVHSTECYGFAVVGNNKKYTYISDTSYSKTIIDQAQNQEIFVQDITEPIDNAVPAQTHAYIKKFIKNSDILITNIDSFIYTKNSKTHLPTLDFLHMVQDENIGRIIIAHINPFSELKYDEWSSKLAKYISQESGIKTLALKPSGGKFEI